MSSDIAPALHCMWTVIKLTPTQPYIRYTHRNPRSSDNIPLSQEMSYIGIYDYQLAMHISHQILKAVHNDISLCECGVALSKYIVLNDVSML